MELTNIQLFLNGIVHYIDVIVGHNEFASGAIIAGLLGYTAYLSKTVPNFLLQQFYKHATVKLVVNNTNISYYHLITFLKDKGLTDRSRFINIVNGFSNWDKSEKAIGYGIQLFWLNWYTPLLIEVSKENSDSHNIKEFLILIKIGRSHVFFDKLLQEIQKTTEDPDKTRIYEYEGINKRYVTTQYNRTFDTLAIGKESLDRLKHSIDSFLGKEEWSLRHQIPWQFGILLYGPPGTGKTSLIRAIAAYMNRDITYVSSISSLQAACKYENTSIIVLEEIDTLSFADSRVTEDSTDLSHIVSDFSKYGLGQVLQALDGVIMNHGRVVIMTTNHPENLDGALIRPGRIDLKLEVTYLTNETFAMMLNRFYPEHTSSFTTVKANISPVEVQNDIILGASPEALEAKYTV